MTRLVDTAFAIAVLEGVRRNLYLSSDDWLRSNQSAPDDQAISILDSFKRYGADVVEDVLEKGSMNVRKPYNPYV